NNPECQRVLFLFVLVNPRTDAAGAESRRRERYATLAALNTAGYVPQLWGRLSYVTIYKDKQSSGSPDALAQLIGSGQQSSRGDYELEKDFVIPYEWALPPDFPNDETGRSMDCKYNSVCVLWIKDNLLRGKLASFLADLQGRLEEFLRKAGNENFC